MFVFFLLLYSRNRLSVRKQKSRMRLLRCWQRCDAPSTGARSADHALDIAHSALKHRPIRGCICLFAPSVLDDSCLLDSAVHSFCTDPCQAFAVTRHALHPRMDRRCTDCIPVRSLCPRVDHACEKSPFEIRHCATNCDTCHPRCEPCHLGLGGRLYP